MKLIILWVCMWVGVEMVEMVEMVEEVEEVERVEGVEGVEGVLVTEVMGDPVPAVGLPEAEWVEVCNAGEAAVDMMGWRLELGSGKGGKVIGFVGSVGGSGGGGTVLMAGEYALLCSRSAAQSMGPYGRVLVVDPWPALRNTGDRITLADPLGEEVHSLVYDPAMYNDALKADGGWSLELGSLYAFETAGAWVASADPSGGTPGRANSQMLSLERDPPPVVLRSGLYGGELLYVLFDGPVRGSGEPARLKPGGRVAEAVRSPEYGFPGLFWRLPESLEPRQIYEPEPVDGVTSVYGEPVTWAPAGFSLPEEADSGDLVINEIQFDPGPGNVEWIELFNRSPHAIELSGTILARADETGRVVSFSDQTAMPFLLLPDSFAVLTPGPELLIRADTTAQMRRICHRPDMPALSNEPSALILMDSRQRVIDKACYNPDWHYPYLAETTGRPLEKTGPALPGTDAASWFSAGRPGGTPGYRNTIEISDTVPGTEEKPVFELVARILHQNGGPVPVPITVKYRFPVPGYFCGLSVYDRQGARIRTVAEFSLAGMEGSYSWDGLTDDSVAVPEGIYLLIAEYRHPDGLRGRWRSACGVVRDY